jgi:SNF2 family DNA or RNA helicase
MISPEYVNIYYNKKSSDSITLIKICSKANTKLYNRHSFYYYNNSNIITGNEIVLSVYYKLPRNNNTINEINIIYTNKPPDTHLDIYYVDFIVINELHSLYKIIKEIVDNTNLKNIDKTNQILELINYKNQIKFNNINDCIDFIDDKFNEFSNGNLVNNISIGLFINSYICRLINDASYTKYILFNEKTLYNININKLFYLYYLALYNGLDFHVGIKLFDTINISGNLAKNKLAMTYIINANNRIISNNCIKESKEIYSPIEFDTTFEDNFSEHIKFTLFDYQKNNVKWMDYIETTKPVFNTKNNISNLKFKQDLNYINYKVNDTKKISFLENLQYKIPSKILKVGSNYCVRYINYINYSNIYYNSFIDKRIYYSIGELKTLKECKEEFYNGSMRMCGGIIADDIGLGKTLSTITHLVNKRNQDRNSIKLGEAELGTMIILPNRLVAQWMYEIGEYLIDNNYLSVAKIGSITDIKKLSKKTKKELQEIDVFLVSNTIFANEKYINEYVICNKGLNLIDTKWNRIIIDEAHELLVMNEKNYYANNIRLYKNYYNINNRIYNNYYHYRKYYLLSKKQKAIAFNIIYNLKSNYRWCLTATPYMHKQNNLVPYLYWLSDYEFNTEYKEERILNTDELSNEELEKYLKPLVNKYFNKLPDIDIDDNFMVEYYKHNNIEKLNAFYNYLSNDDFEQFMRKFVSKNSKRELQNADVIYIPLVTEEIIYVNQSPIEKQIYDSYENGTINIHCNKVNLLHKLCTNLLITQLFNVNSESESASARLENIELLSLDEINKQFIGNLKRKINTAETSLSNKKNYIKTNKEQLLKIAKLLEYFSEISIKEYIELMYSVIKNYGDKNMNKTKLKAELDKKSGNGIHTFINKSSMNIVNRFVDNSYNTYYKSAITEFITNLIKLEDLSDIISNKNKLIELISTYLLLLEDKREEYKYIYHTNIINKYIEKNKESCEGKIERANIAINEISYSIERLSNQLKIMEDEDFINEHVKDPCIICLCDYEDDTEIIITKCRHITCAECFNMMMGNKSSINCPQCRGKITMNDITKTRIRPPTTDKQPVVEVKENQDEYAECVNKYGSKMAMMIKYLKRMFNANDTDRAIIFSQYDEMLLLIKKVLDDYNIKYVFCKGNVNVISKNIIKFKKNTEYRVILLSSDKANSGSNLTEASHIILIDVLNMEKEHAISVETQAIGRAVRLGQNKNVKVVRFITRNTIEETKFLDNRYDLLET